MRSNRIVRILTILALDHATASDPALDHDLMAAIDGNKVIGAWTGASGRTP